MESVRITESELPGAQPYEVACGNLRTTITMQLAMLRSRYGLGMAAEGKPLWTECALGKGGSRGTIRVATDSITRATVRIPLGGGDGASGQRVYTFDATNPQNPTLIQENLTPAGEPLDDSIHYGDDQTGFEALTATYNAVFLAANAPGAPAIPYTV